MKTTTEGTKSRPKLSKYQKKLKFRRAAQRGKRPVPLPHGVPMYVNQKRFETREEKRDFFIRVLRIWKDAGWCSFWPYKKDPHGFIIVSPDQKLSALYFPASGKFKVRENGNKGRSLYELARALKLPIQPEENTCTPI